jgi:hypothetical protein
MNLDVEIDINGGHDFENVNGFGMGLLTEIWHPFAPYIDGNQPSGVKTHNNIWVDMCFATIHDQ